MKEFDSIIIGFGKAGKTLAGFQAKAGEKVALIEASSQMYGGTCINVGCIPSKTLETQARLSASIGGSWVRTRYQSPASHSTCSATTKP